MTIHVTSARGPYQVLIEPGALTKLPSLLRARGLDGRRLVVSTPPVWRRHGRRLLNVAGRGARPALIPDGERGKTLRMTSLVVYGIAARIIVQVEEEGELDAHTRA